MASKIRFLRRKSRHILKIITVGDPAVGKTSLLYRYTTGKFAGDYTPTLGVNFLFDDVTVREAGSDKEKIVQLQLWDIAGHSRFASFKNWYYTGTHGVVLIFDLTRLSTLKSLEPWKNDILSYVPSDQLKDNFAILGNKVDLQRKVTPQQLTTAQRFLKTNKAFETSAKTGEKVTSAFQYLAQLVLNSNLPNLEEITFKSRKEESL